MKEKKFYSPHFPVVFSLAFLIIICQFKNSNAQTSAPANIFKDSVYSSVAVSSNIPYGINFNHFFNKIDTLLVDTYEPEGTIDYRRPLLIYCHGGGFTAGEKTTDHAITLGNYFAKHGYLVASIDYRLGVDNVHDTVDNFQIVYQATQDAKSAVRFFKRYADTYCLDTSAFFMMGTSAGGSLALTTAYWDQDETTTWVDPAIWGTLDQSSGNPGYSSHVNGVISCWGGIPDTAWFKNETEPNQLFHGDLDVTVPYTQGIGASGLFEYGSFDIHDACLRDEVPSSLHTFWGYGHGVAEESLQFDTLEQISADFLFNHLPPAEGSLYCDESAGTNDVSSSSSLQVYPNPSDGHFFLHSSVIKNGTLNLYTLTGQLVTGTSLLIFSNSVNEINFSSVPSGIYFLKISDDHGMHVCKLIIHKF